MPVQVLGLQGSPNAGDEFLAVENERKAREVALYRQGKFRDVKLAKQASKMDDVFAQMEEQKAGVIPILLKTDVQGSAEALRDALNKLSTDEVAVKIIASGVGGITISDVQLAAASQGAHHRLQRARRRGRARRDEGRRSRGPLLQHHLRSHRRR